MRRLAPQNLYHASASISQKRDIAVRSSRVRGQYLSFGGVDGKTCVCKLLRQRLEDEDGFVEGSREQQQVVSVPDIREPLLRVVQKQAIVAQSCFPSPRWQASLCSVAEAVLDRAL